MSNILLSKLDIDVLIQLALIGPDGAAKWEPLTDSPDQLGLALWRRNYEVAGDPDFDDPPTGYMFTPLPITVTAVEGLKHCRFYRYQTADEGSWGRDGMGEFLDRLDQALVGVLPGMDEAPWGWDARALEGRSDRLRPQFVTDGDEPPEDPRITAWLEQWAAAGLPLTRTPPGKPRYYKMPDPREVLTSGYYRPPDHTGLAPVVVTLLGTKAATDLYFASYVRERQGTRHIDSHVYRWGFTVAATTFSLAFNAHFIPEVDRNIAKLGDPDEHWWSLAPPLRELDAEIIATRVRLNRAAAGAHADSRAIFARTPTELDAVVGMIDDAELRERVAAMNTRKQTVVLMRGVAEIAAVTSASIEQEIHDRGRGPKTEHAMHLSTEGATFGIATLLVIDRLTQTPANAVINDRLINTAMFGDRPRPRT